MPRKSWSWGVLAAAVMAVAAAGLLVLAKVTPWYTDYEAFKARNNAIYEQGQAGAADRRSMSKAFHANRRRYETNKWLYADAGYLLAAWSVVVGGLSLAAARRGFGFLGRTTAKAVILVPVSMLAVIGFAATMIFGIGQLYGREQVPIWSSSGAGVGALIIIACVSPVLAIYTLAPAIFRRRSAGPLLVLRGRSLWPTVVVSLLYAPPFALCGLLIYVSKDAGGWAASTTAALLIWLLLNARALWIHPSPKV